MPAIAQGSIVLALVADPQGRNPKVRPLVVITSNADLPTAEQIVTVAITGEFVEPIQPDEVRLQYHPQGNCRTKLRKRCVAKCSWRPVIEKSAIIEVKSFVPLPQLERILEIVAIP